jgi:hypothetical protein
MDQHGETLSARALAAEAEAYDLQLVSARLIGRGRVIAQASREARRQYTNTLALVWESRATYARLVIRSRHQRGPG